MLHYFQVITVVWRLWWLGGQMWTWTFLTWAQRSIQLVSAKSWSVPGNSWGKVSSQHSVDLYISIQTGRLYEHTYTHRYTHIYCAQTRKWIHKHIWIGLDEMDFKSLRHVKTLHKNSHKIIIWGEQFFNKTFVWPNVGVLSLFLMKYLIANDMTLRAFPVLQH